MGSYFSVTVNHHSDSVVKMAVDSCLKFAHNLESQISSWQKNSDTYKVNQNSGIKAVKVNPTLFNLVKRSKLISEITGGYFDISFASIDKFWDVNKSYSQVPDSSQIKESVQLIDYTQIELDEVNYTIFLKKKGMKIGFGAIGKGFLADECIKLLKSLGVESAVINAGGDLKVIGKKNDGKKWSVGIIDPDNKSEYISYLEIENQGIVTSGNYERFIQIKDKKYCHIIDPKTGWPVEGVKSVTVIAASSELADALATTVFVLGPTEGIALIEQIPNVECVIIDNNKKIFQSKNIELKTKNS